MIRNGAGDSDTTYLLVASSIQRDVLRWMYSPMARQQPTVLPPIPRPIRDRPMSPCRHRIGRRGMMEDRIRGWFDLVLPIKERPAAARTERPRARAVSFSQRSVDCRFHIVWLWTSGRSPP